MIVKNILRLNCCENVPSIVNEKHPYPDSTMRIASHTLQSSRYGNISGTTIRGNALGVRGESHCDEYVDCAAAQTLKIIEKTK
jgi:hypothetical protein